MNPVVYAVATMDTKGEELTFVAQCLRDAGVSVKTVDVGTHSAPTVNPDVSREHVLGDTSLPVGDDRGAAVTAMGVALTTWLLVECAAGRVAGVVGIGGSGGTALVTAAMRTLPIGLPKLMVSTMASGNTAPYVDCSDITMMYSVVDVAGLNVVSEKILSNAAHAMAGMVTHNLTTQESRPALGMTMFGVTTPCVTAVRKTLEAKGYDCLVFHATGSGGRAMEQLVDSGLIGGVLDITTTEVADEVVGGVLPAGFDRFEKLLAKGVPLVLSLGAVDMVNFGGIDTVPEQFRDRTLHVHNAQVTLMRTNEEECRNIARWIADKMNQSTSPWSLLIPEGGVSMLDAPGQAFYAPAANAALFDELEHQIRQTDERKIIRLPHQINDPQFAQALVDQFELLCPTVSH
ncbi:MAG: Tm-1-like ATP-binding domain-containing protein [Fuerstiella sp.]|nr:Tm-1-like ATP-binding domain-containing protein [Fuerstiella sp.]